MDQQVKKVINFLQDDLHPEVDLSSIAKSMNLSWSRLRHLFKAETTAPVQYVKSLKMRKAKELLEVGQITPGGDYRATMEGREVVY